MTKMKKTTEYDPDRDSGDSSVTTVRKCNKLLLTILYGAVRMYYFLCGVKIKEVSETPVKPESPSIILCNHGSFIDFIFAESVLRKNHPHFIAARLYFYHTVLGGLLRRVGAFPKSMFASDIESTKNCLKVLSGGEILAMMPEARLSTAGRFEDIQPSTFSFLKKSGVPIYTVKFSGDYFADPKWGNGPRRGAVVLVEMSLLLRAEEIRAKSADEIRAAVEEKLYYDEFEWLKTRPEIRYRSKKLAEGLHNILAICPVCGEKHTLYTKKCSIYCKNCGKLTELDDRYNFAPGFRFANFGEWYDWQKQIFEERILSDGKYTLTSPVELRLPGNGGSLTRYAGRGVCTLDRGGLSYVGERDGEPYEVSFPLERVYRLLFGAGVNFEIYNGKEILFFVPDVKQSAVEWYLTSMIMYDNAVAVPRH